MRGAVRIRSAVVVVLGILGLLACVMLAPEGQGQTPPQNQAAEAPTTVDKFLDDQFDYTVTSIEIAPMVKKGDATPGDWTAAKDGFWKAILARVGIKPCVTDPKDLKGKPGVQDYISDSNVLNKGGTRATIGYFVKVKGDSPDGPVTQEFFILMSYDTIKDKAANKTLCAFEVFMFGPLPRPGSQAAAFIKSGTAPLFAGLAVNDKGELLKEVPLTIAKVKNFQGGDTPETETVKPGVNSEGVGCFKCHGRDDQFPEETLPFPWIGKVDGSEKKPEGPKTATATPQGATVKPNAQPSPAPAAPQTGNSTPPNQGGAGGNQPAQPQAPSGPQAIPSPPAVKTGGTEHQALQDLNSPTHAAVTGTGQTLTWDPTKKSWIDDKTGEALGFQGALAKDGTVIPAPPVLSDRPGVHHQAQQDKNDPERAYDSRTGQNLKWDRTKASWVDAKTGNVVGFSGAYASAAGSTGASPVIPGGEFGFGFGFGVGGGRGDHDQPRSDPYSKKP